MAAGGHHWTPITIPRWQPNRLDNDWVDSQIQSSEQQQDWLYLETLLWRCCVLWDIAPAILSQMYCLTVIVTIFSFWCQCQCISFSTNIQTTLLAKWIPSWCTILPMVNTSYLWRLPRPIFRDKDCTIGMKSMPTVLCVYRVTRATGIICVQVCLYL